MNNLEEIKKLKKYKSALYNIDMVEGFVNSGPMANKNYNNLVPEQLKIMRYFLKKGASINLIGEEHRKDALEFRTYPAHCVLGTKEVDFIPELNEFINLPDTRIYRKNSINGMLNDKLRNDIFHMDNLEIAVFMGVCEDLCVMDFVRTYARYLDEINKKVDLFVVSNATDTFDSPDHNRDEWKKIAKMVMKQAGVIYVDDFSELKKYEKKIMKN